MKQQRARTAVVAEQDVAPIENAVVALLGVVVALDGGAMVCGLCEQRDEHKDGCPVPALEQWINPS